MGQTDRMKLYEESLREAAGIGDYDCVLELFSTGVNIDAKNSMNGWTALHWAAKRGHKDIVRALIEQGADPTITNDKGETPLNVATHPEIRVMLGGCETVNGSVVPDRLPITPNYLKNTSLAEKVELPNPPSAHSHRRSQDVEPYSSNHFIDGELVLKVRVANGGDPDFIEIELPRTELTYYSLLRVCCEELALNASQVVRIRKLPNTMLRKDKDVQRLTQMQELEVVVTHSGAKHQPNGYKSIQLYKNQTILY